MKFTHSLLSLSLFAILAACGGSKGKGSRAPDVAPKAGEDIKTPNDLAGNDEQDESKDEDKDEGEMPPIPPLPPVDEIPKYQPLTAVFSDPSEVLAAENTELTLQKLLSIASPTNEYHADLLALVKNAKVLRSEQLTMLLKAVYFTLAERDQMNAEFDTIKSSESEADKARADQLYKYVILGTTHSKYMVHMLIEGLPKTEGLTPENAKAMFALLYPANVSEKDHNDAYTALSTKLTSIPTQLKRKLMVQANEKKAWKSAIRFGLEFFDESSDKSAQAIISLASEIDKSQNESLFLGGIKLLSELTYDDVLALTQQSGGKSSIALAALNKSTDQSHQKVLDLAKIVQGETELGLFANNMLDFYTKVSTQEIKDFITAFPKHHQNFASKAGQKWSAATIQGSLDLADSISTNAKATWILGCLSHFNDFTTEETLKLAETSGFSWKVVKAINDQGIIGLDYPTILKISKKLPFTSNRYEWIDSTLDKLSSPTNPRPLTVAKLEEILDTEPSSKGKIAAKSAALIDFINGDDIARISSALSYSIERRDWINAVFDELHIRVLKPLKAADVVKILSTGPDRQEDIVVTSAGLMASITGSDMIAISNALSYSTSRKAWLMAAFEVLRSTKSKILSSDEVSEFLATGPNNQDLVAIESAPFLIDLKAKDIVIISNALPYSASRKDWILAAFEELKDRNSLAFTGTELAEILATQPDSKGTIAKAAVPYLKEITGLDIKAVSNALDYSISRKDWILEAFAELGRREQKTLSSSDVVSILETGPDKAGAIAEASAPILKEIKGIDIEKISRQLSYASARSDWIKAAFAEVQERAVEKLTSADLIKILATGPDKIGTVAVAAAPLVKELTSDAIVEVANALSNSPQSKLDWIMAALSTTNKKFGTDEIIDIIDASDMSKVQIANKALDVLKEENKTLGDIDLIAEALAQGSRQAFKTNAKRKFGL